MYIKLKWNKHFIWNFFKFFCLHQATSTAPPPNQVQYLMLHFEKNIKMVMFPSK